MAAVTAKVCLYITLILTINKANTLDDGTTQEKAAAEKENKYHLIDTAFLLVMMFLLIITVLTVWLFKVKRFRFLHETGVCMIYGMVVGLLIKYVSGGTRVAVSQPNCTISSTTKKLYIRVENGSQYSYTLSGPVKRGINTDQGNELEQMAVFDPEIFFYVLLPPIIFYAGYDMKKRFFFRNIGAILVYAFVGTTVSCIVFGGTMYAYIKFIPNHIKDFNFLECLLFGALISATDPVTVLAIFHDLHVDVDLYALVFGESVMNDAVAIVLFRSVESYLLDNASDFQVGRFFKSVGVFIGVFSGSFFLGFAMGLVTALVTKLTKISDFPLLETALFFLLSWATFLMAEAANLTGIVAVLFCGISQAHYTYNNLSEESKQTTKQTFALLNFLAESFIFSYMGLSLFTFEYHQWDAGFISWTFLAMTLGRLWNIYPLSFLLNLGRHNKISYNFQHMMVFAGLRGAVAFALAMRNTETVPRQMMLTSVLIVVLVTVIINGGATMSVLSLLKIRVGVDPEEEDKPAFVSVSTGEDNSLRSGQVHYERAWIFRKWYDFDVKFMKPIFTNRGQPLTQTLPDWCGPLARCLSPQPEPKVETVKGDSDEDMLDIHGELSLTSGVMVRPTSDNAVTNDGNVLKDGDVLREGDLGLGAIRSNIV
ncbi:PREDICTED: sodium/hydrogen exchanger 7-like isoform X1 [Acropora digitifera]|uniref:sodium/hydrogen exchanger 7-like isoform X1 n=1 Tax=Acropora digitifera TaxID=70779 RepID=UPI00077AD145|nr:PREDICTED: sodium/hydrogen exchanger 7-like isoform X1 [Acropora digitifera]